MFFFKRQKYTPDPALFHKNRFLPASPMVSRRSLVHRTRETSLTARFILNAAGRQNPRITPSSRSSISIRRILWHPLLVFFFTFVVTLFVIYFPEYGFHLNRGVILSRLQQIPISKPYPQPVSQACHASPPTPLPPQPVAPQPPSAPVQPTTSRSQLEDVISSAVIRHSKDMISLRDFGLGARYIPELTTTTPSGLSMKQRFVVRLVSRLTSFDFMSRIGQLPSMALMEKIGEGYCWKFPGSYGHLGIALKERISIHQVSIDHISRELASDAGILQAPCRMVFWGRVDGEHNKALAKMYLHHLRSRKSRLMNVRPEGFKVGKDFYIPLFRFEYKLLGSSHSNVQTASASEYLKSLNMDFAVVVLEILDNWGGESTCLHRVRVHGSPNKSLTIHNTA